MKKWTSTRTSRHTAVVAEAVVAGVDAGAVDRIPIIRTTISMAHRPRTPPIVAATRRSLTTTGRTKELYAALLPIKITAAFAAFIIIIGLKSLQFCLFDRFLAFLPL